MGQASLWATLYLTVYLGPFAIREVTGNFALGGLPLATYSLAGLLVIPPAGRLMDRVGRAPVIAFGHLVAAIGAVLVASILIAGLHGLAGVAALLAGFFVMSAGSGIAILTRVAAADLYPPERRARGIGRVLLVSFAGSVLGATVFVLLARGGNVPVAAGYLTMLPFFGIGCGAMLAYRRFGMPFHRGRALANRDMRSLARRPQVRWTIASNAGANAGMVGVMSLASPALFLAGPAATGAIMLAHFGGMFLPSPVAGQVADRRGRAVAIAGGGAVLALGAILFSQTGIVPLAGLGLFLVGAGWCFTFIPGTALLADETNLAERGSIFGINDALVAVLGAVAILLAGGAFYAWGPAGLAVLGGSFALVSVLAGLWLRRAHAMQVARPTSGAAPENPSR